MGLKSGTNENGWTWIFRNGKSSQERSIENPLNQELEKIASSFYVTNFPESLDARVLWKLCEPFGRIVDAYIARKSSKLGKRFGFVRFLGVLNEVEFAKKLATIWIDNYHMYAAVARFQRSNTKHMSRKAEDEVQNASINKNEQPKVKLNNMALHPHKGNQSYASIVHGGESSKNMAQNSNGSKTITLHESDLIKVEDTTKVVLVKVKEVETMVNMYRICKNEDFTNLKIHHVGGLWTWIQFPNAEAYLAFKDNVNTRIMFGTIKPVSKNFIVDERMTWVEVNGPLCAWGSVAFKKVISIYGNFMFFEVDQASNVSTGRVCIATKHLNHIYDEINVMINGESFAVQVRELATWSIKIEDENDEDDSV